ncbi:hypothetical protein [Planomicrobium okeanokoites]|uniref:Uncharacterized protein n=1 Tax=Planomicrobium okeanokoites TaxID=244 RepID=A0ABV7KTD1_PLAOK|nr:hypothetical protein [Planomicrobium okeanokoites]TAA70271.1 hypothetical protein D2910_07420 [Planomicrobium okeanokoites]
MVKISEEKKVMFVMLLAIAAIIYAVIDIILQIQAGFFSRIFISFLILVQAVLIIYIVVPEKKKP